MKIAGSVVRSGGLRRFRNITCLTVVLWGAGCESYHGIRPLKVSEVASLRPTFKWEDAGDGATYDFAIWDAIYKYTAVPGQSLYKVGNQIYLRKGLTGTSHRPDVTLLPIRLYFRSVKLSSESTWSTYGYGSGGLFTFSTKSP